jgi:ankyrin repeat protein
VATNRSNGNSLLHLSALYGLRDAAALLLKAGAERKMNRPGFRRGWLV